MEVSTMKSADLTESRNDVQGMFLPMSAASEAMRKRACEFWESQDKILDGMQIFADGWFERRHTGTRAALDAAERICMAKSPVDQFREYQDWASGAFQRVMADGFACQKQFMEAVGALGHTWMPFGESGTKPPQAETRPARAKAA
jgi:hypothetical protein